MSALPSGWAEARLDELADVRLGRQRSPKNHAGDRMRPYLRAANVTWRGLDLRDVKEMNFSEPESKVYELCPGDVLVAEASGSASEVGKPALWKGEIEGCCFQNTLVRVRSRGPIPEYLCYFLFGEARSGRLGDAAPGVGIHHIGAARLSAWRIAVPPLNEQQRIVVMLDEQFSRLDAASANLHRVELRSEAMRRSVLDAAFAPVDRVRRLGDLAETQLGKMLSAKSRTGVGARPYLRNKNVQWGRIDLDDVFEMDFSERDIQKFSLQPGDVLVCEGGDVGRSAIWRGGIEGCCYQKALHRVRVGDQLLPDYLIHVMRWLADRNAFDPYVTGSTIKHLPQEDLRLISIPAPAIAEQRRIVSDVEGRLSLLDGVLDAVESAKRRSAALRRSMLERAFRGELVPQDPTDEPASVLLARIAADRAAATRKQRRPVIA